MFTKGILYLVCLILITIIVSCGKETSSSSTSAQSKTTTDILDGKKRNYKPAPRLWDELGKDEMDKTK